MVKKALAFTMCILMLIAMACSGEGNLVQTGKARALSEGMPAKSLADAQNAFGFDIIMQLSQAYDNVIISPLSLAMAFHLVVNGADKIAEDAILGRLGNGMGKEEINTANAQLMRMLLNPDLTKTTDKLPAPNIKIANAVFIDDDQTANADFAQTALDYFRASMYTADFPFECVKAINNYIERQTEGLIKNAVEKLDPDTVMAIVNTLYFEAKWKLQFNDRLTDKGIFYGTKNINETDMMHMQQTTGYYEDDKLQAVSLDYAGEEYAMAVILPKQGTAAQVLGEIGPDGLKALFGSFDNEWVKLTLPRFKIDCKYNLMETARALGMGDALVGGQGGFPYLMENSGVVKIGDIIHCTTIEVTEAGTKAAATTIIGMVQTSFPTDVKTMTVDKPFAFAIYHKPTGTILFLGAVTNL